MNKLPAELRDDINHSIFEYDSIRNKLRQTESKETILKWASGLTGLNAVAPLLGGHTACYMETSSAFAMCIMSILFWQYYKSESSALYGKKYNYQEEFKIKFQVRLADWHDIFGVRLVTSEEEETKYLNPFEDSSYK